MAADLSDKVGPQLGPAALAGLLIGALTSGFMLAIEMANAGGAWDNAKKWVEGGDMNFAGESYKKGTPYHDATVVGDTVGDPFKDTSGPSLNILIKLMSIMSLTLAPIFRGDWTTWWEGMICTSLMLIIISIAYYFVWVKAPPPPETKDMGASDNKA